MNRLVIHMGTEKTGSKALQIALRTGSGKGYIYQDQGNGAVWHRRIHDALAAMPPDLGPLDAALAQIGAAPLGVISYEGSHCLPDAALDLLSERARAWGRETFAVVFLRRQDEYASSRANQVWKAHRTPFDLAESRARSFINGTNPSLDYECMLERLAGRFDRVRPLIYERGRSSIGSFAATTGIALDEVPYDPNPAASAVEIATLRELKRRAGSDPRLPEIVESTRRLLARRGLVRWLARLVDGPTGPLDAKTAERILSLHAAANQRLHARWFPDQKQLFPEAISTSHRRPFGPPRWDVVWRIGRRFGI